MKKKVKNISELSQTHGKLEEKEYKTLDQIWGDDGIRKYKTLDEVQYVASLKEMNKSDLQAHASKFGLIPVDDRETLIKRLTREFKKHVSLYSTPKQKNNHINLDKKTRDILAEGR
jgi:hypothetical protein